jgi:hypothetical protein
MNAIAVVDAPRANQLITTQALLRRYRSELDARRVVIAHDRRIAAAELRARIFGRSDARRRIDQ